MYTLMHKYIQCRHKHYTTKYKLRAIINLVFSSQNSEQCNNVNIMYLCGYIVITIVQEG